MADWTQGNGVMTNGELTRRVQDHDSEIKNMNSKLDEIHADVTVIKDRTDRRREWFHQWTPGLIASVLGAFAYFIAEHIR